MVFLDTIPHLLSKTAWEKILLLLPYVAFLLSTYQYVWTMRERYKPELERSASASGLRTIYVRDVEAGVAARLTLTSTFSMILPLIIDFILGNENVYLTPLLLVTSLITLILSAVASPKNRLIDETSKISCAFFSICFFTGNAGYILFCDQVWPWAILGFCIFFVTMIIIIWYVVRRL